jgi:hypothetical protein
MWKKIRPFLLAAKLDPVRVENPIHPGTPDVNLSDGKWIELKTVDRWPVRENTILRIGHYTPQQRVWLYQRWKYAPGSTLLLLEVRSERQWLLFDGDVAAKVVGRVTAAEHRANARAQLDVHDLAELPKILVGHRSVDRSCCHGSERVEEYDHDREENAEIFDQRVLQDLRPSAHGGDRQQPGYLRQRHRRDRA